VNNGGCDTDADCANTLGSFTCNCHIGFDGDGFTCTGGSKEIIVERLSLPKQYIFFKASESINSLKLYRMAPKSKPLSRIIIKSYYKSSTRLDFSPILITKWAK